MSQYSLNSIYFYPTSRCNLQCVHCWISPEYQAESIVNEDEMSIDAIKKMIDEICAFNVRNIKLTGGEPYLREGINEVISYIIEKGLRIIIETNGTLIGKDEAEILGRAKEKNRLFVSVSIDGADADTHEYIRKVKGSFANSMEGIQELLGYNISVQIITALYRNNISQIDKMVQLCEDMKAHSLKINIISGIEKGKAFCASDNIVSLKEILGLNRYIENDLQKRTNLKIILDIPPAFKSFKYVRKHRGVCGLKHILGILANGDISLCGIGVSVDELIMGNIQQDNLRDVWENNEILKVIRNDVPDKLESVCGMCIFKAFCKGKCVAEAYYRTGRLTAGFGFCEHAYEEGLFPEDRLVKKYARS